jgi:hypothetical protein
MHGHNRRLRDGREHPLDEVALKIAYVPGEAPRAGLIASCPTFIYQRCTLQRVMLGPGKIGDIAEAAPPWSNSRTK